MVFICVYGMYVFMSAWCVFMCMSDVCLWYVCVLSMCMVCVYGMCVCCVCVFGYASLARFLILSHAVLVITPRALHIPGEYSASKHFISSCFPLIKKIKFLCQNIFACQLAYFCLKLFLKTFP